MRFFFVCIFCVLALLGMKPVLAEDAAIPASQTQIPNNDEDFIDINYAPLTYDNLALLYWALGFLHIEDDQAVEGYLRIKECDLYTYFRTDDMDWPDLLKAGRQKIEKSKSSFPTRLAFVVPITLGLYDPEKEIFSLTPETAILGMRMFEAIGIDAYKFMCDVQDREAFVPGYPKNFIFEISHPLLLVEIPFPKNRAQEYLDNMQRRLKTLPERERTMYNAIAMRDAYLVMKLRFITAKSELYRDDTNGSSRLPHLLAVLERYDIYADQDLTQHLYGKAVRKKK